VSGPKRGTWHIPYDPTPARLDDLSEFAARQRTWLERHGGLVERFLGTQALAEARRAYQLVLACVEDGDPDAGFDAYGAAWALFNALHRDACEARRRRILEVQERQQRAAREVLAECTQVWAGEENQRLLSRWLEPVERARLESDLAAAAAGPAEIAPGDPVLEGQLAPVGDDILEDVLRPGGAHLGAAIVDVQLLQQARDDVPVGDDPAQPVVGPRHDRQPAEAELCYRDALAIAERLRTRRGRRC